MTQPAATRRTPRLETDLPESSANEQRVITHSPIKTRRRVWTTQSIDGFASSMHQPHFALNLFSIVFFCAGCLMLLMSSHQRVIQLVMSDCQSRSQTIESRNNEFEAPKLRSNPIGDLDRKRFKELRLQTDPTVLEASKNVSKSLKLEFVVPGNEVPFPEALQLSFPYSNIEDVNYSSIIEKEEKEEEDTQEGEISGGQKVRLFIGITSACCNEKSAKSRNEIRKTWMTRSRKTHPDVDIKFFVGQPSPEQLPEAIKYLTEEVRSHDDLVLVRGLDVYDNLPNKTFGMLKYTLASPQKYTHFLKTDDDSYVRVHKLLESLDGGNGPKMDRVYKGCLENRAGFYPIRDTNSKWYLKYDEFDDFMAQPIRGTKYLAGWGYVLSRDVMFHAMKKVYSWDNDVTVAPAWYLRMKWEDVMMGALVADLIPFPDADFRFKAAWRACTNETAIRHLDLDAPALFQGLFAQDQSGLWNKKTVQCSSGSYVAGDYSGWKRWRNSVIEKELRI